eukprot:3486479-Rhodomonas_salina.1
MGNKLSQAATESAKALAERKLTLYDTLSQDEVIVVSARVDPSQSGRQSDRQGLPAKSPYRPDPRCGKFSDHFAQQQLGLLMGAATRAPLDQQRTFASPQGVEVIAKNHGATNDIVCVSQAFLSMFFSPEQLDDMERSRPLTVQ